jgi:hypothetical protein
LARRQAQENERKSSSRALLLAGRTAASRPAIAMRGHGACAASARLTPVSGWPRFLAGTFPAHFWRAPGALAAALNQLLYS